MAVDGWVSWDDHPPWSLWAEWAAGKTAVWWPLAGKLCKLSSFDKEWCLNLDLWWLNHIKSIWWNHLEFWLLQVMSLSSRWFSCFCCPERSPSWCVWSWQEYAKEYSRHFIQGMRRKRCRSMGQTFWAQQKYVTMGCMTFFGLMGCRSSWLRMTFLGWLMGSRSSWLKMLNIVESWQG